jgi:Fe-S oxidoreductase
MGIFDLFRTETFYFPGCLSSAFLKSKIENYKKILRKIGISFKTAGQEDFVCCGAILEQGGYEKQTRKLAKENAGFLKKRGIKKIITHCAMCFEMLKNYQELLPNFDTEIEFIISSALSAIRENEKLLENSFYESIFYYDSCILGRNLKYTEQPRELLRLFGYNVLEIPNYNKEETLCCGSCGNLPITNSELAESICLDFIKKIKKLKIRKIATADNHAYYFLKKIISKFNISGIQILEISDIICDSLGIEKAEESSISPKEETEEEQEVKEIIKQAEQK